MLARAKERDVGVVAMKTLMGARLNDLRPLRNAGRHLRAGRVSLVLSNRDIDALVISMTSTADIDEYLGASGARELATGDAALLQRYLVQNGLTYCRHACDDCSGACPYNVPIADVLRTRMYAIDYQDMTFARAEYARLPTNAQACLDCSGAPCRSACTHGIPIDRMCGPTHRMLA